MPKIKVNDIEIEATPELLQKVQEALSNPKQTAKEWLLDYMSKPFEVRLTKGYITYYRDGQWVFQQDIKDKILWCYYYEVWQVFERDFGMKYDEIQALQKDVVGETLNCRDFTTPFPAGLQTMNGGRNIKL